MGSARRSIAVWTGSRGFGTATEAGTGADDAAATTVAGTGTGAGTGAVIGTAACAGTAGAVASANATACGVAGSVTAVPASPEVKDGRLALAGLLVARGVCLAPTSDGPSPLLKAAKSVMSGEAGSNAGAAAGGLACAGAGAATGTVTVVWGIAGTAGPPTSAMVGGVAAALVATAPVALAIADNEAGNGRSTPVLSAVVTDVGKGRFTMPCRCSHSTPPVPASSTTAAAVPSSRLRRDG